jgi:hypothetical protein
MRSSISIYSAKGYEKQLDNFSKRLAKIESLISKTPN